MSISGNIRTMPFADLLQWVAQSRKTGTLAIEGPDFVKKIYFRDGIVVASSSNDPREFLSYYVVGWGFIGEEELQELLSMQDRHGTMLGELLVIIGRVTREELQRLLQVKTEETILDLFLRDEGEFRFLENILPAKKFQPLAVAADTLILEGVRRRDEWRRISGLIRSPAVIPKVVRAIEMRGMGESEVAIIREINGVNSIERIALAARLPLYSVMEFVYQGTIGGLFNLLEAAKSEPGIPGFSQGAWRLAVQDAEQAFARGDLGAAARGLAEIRRNFPQSAQAVEAVTSLEGKIEQQVMESCPAADAVLQLAVPPSELMRLPCSPEEGFLLSRVDGRYTLGEIVKVVPGTDLEVRLMIRELIQRGTLRVQAPAKGESRARA